LFKESGTFPNLDKISWMEGNFEGLKKWPGVPGGPEADFPVG
jgi:hypothetical protein